ncbi:general secretion pathway protein [Planctomycetales bacterium]|nr:general secretion pathway protein [Planctomycetales bacterium]
MHIFIVLLAVVLLTCGCRKNNEAVFVGESTAPNVSTVPEEPQPPKNISKQAVKIAEPEQATPPPVPVENPESTPEAILAELQKQTDEAVAAERKRQEAERQRQAELAKQEALRKQAEAERLAAEEAKRKAEENAKKGVNTASPVNTNSPVKNVPVNTNPPVNTASPVQQNLSFLRLTKGLALFGILVLQDNSGTTAAANETRPAANESAPANVPSQIRFNFRYAPWKDVIEWFADQAGLSLQADTLPTGTLNLTDSQYYTPTEGLDVLNSYLLFKEYTIVRKGKSMFVIYLPDGIPANLLEPITPAELDNRGKYEICRCVFGLNRTTPEIIQAETEKLLGPQGSLVIMPKSQQIVITETAGTLRTIRDIIKRIDNPEALASGTLQTIEPKNLAADEALGIMRKLLSIDESDASLRTAVDATGKIIWMTGRGDMIERAKDIIKTLDDSFGADKSALDGQPQFEVHDTGSADPATVLAVLQTLLAGTPDVRLSLDTKTGGIAVLGRPANQATVREAIRQMQLNTPQIDVIPLKRISPLSAVESIKKFFATSSPATSPTTTTTAASVAVNAANATAPTVEADTAAQQIIVRGTITQIQQIRALLLKLGEDGIAGARTDTSTVRTITIPSAAAPFVLEQLQNVLPKINPNIKIVTPNVITPDTKTNTDEKINQLIDDTFDKDLTDVPRTKVSFVLCQYTTEKTAQPVIITLTPTGLMLSSDNPEALNEVEGLIRMLSDESVLGKTSLQVYYLKNATAEVVSPTLQTLLGTNTGEAQGVSGAGTGISDEQRAAVLGVLGQGNAVEKTGTVYISADSRLNALLIQANPVDHKTIERLLPILDQAGRDDILNRPRPRLIPLKNIRAEEAKATVETVFSARLQSGASGNANAAQQGGRNRGSGGDAAAMPQPMPGGMPGGMAGMPPGGPGMMMQQLLSRMGNQGGSSTPKEAEEKMTLDIDVRSNSLIVSAPETLFLSVKTFVEELDLLAAQQETVVETVMLKNINTSVAKQALANALGTAVTFTENKAVTTQPQTSGSSPFGNTNSGFGGFGQQGSGFGTFNRGGATGGANPFLNMLRGGGGMNRGFGGGTIPAGGFRPPQ